jgi:hypothetical protein
MTKSINDRQFEALNNPGYYTASVVVGSGAIDGTHQFTDGGFTKYITVGAGEMEGTGTATFTMVDKMGGTVFSQTRVEKGTSTHGSQVPFGTAFEMRVTADATQAADATVNFAIHYGRHS